MFTNVTASSTNLLITPETTGFDLTWLPSRTFELRVTNWAYGVQIDSVHLSSNGTMIKLPDYGRTIEFIGDSLTAGDYDTYEGLASYGWGVAEGLGNTEYSITAYPGICLVDKNCWGNEHGQEHQWQYTSDTSWRATQIWGDNPEPWPFKQHAAADLVIINIGTNDNNTANNVTSEEYYPAYVDFVQTVHETWPSAQIILISLWGGFSPYGSTYVEVGAWKEEIYNVYKHYENQGFVHYFNTTGIMQHNDIGPQWHPTDVGQIKLASHLLQYIKLKFGWDLEATGPEVQHGTHISFLK
jgi:lysophospholipase L1-like esterase